MAVQKTKAIVIGYYPLGETDRIIVFYTRDHGKIRAVARGIRNIKSRLSGRLEILTYGNLVFFERVDKDLHTVNSFDIIESFQELREDLLKMTYCSYLAELIQKVEPESEANFGTFDLMLNIMLMMETTDDPEVLARAFEIRLLTEAGLSLRLDSCTACSSDIDNSNPGFNVSAGGVLCSKCSQSDPRTIFISRGTLELMKRIQQAPLKLIPRLRISEVNRQELKKILSGFISFHIDIESLHSLSFLESITREA